MKYFVEYAFGAKIIWVRNQTIANLSQKNLHLADQMDRAQIESNAAFDLRTRDRSVNYYKN
ncbi:MAG: hypothetical protein CM15mP117_19490 [Alphaproteobacteria bacterium]|nr:MAG: hypothetical protein CM15mP117_19490 [Alphaproteobacteria bacterium]